VVASTVSVSLVWCILPVD